MMRFSSELRGGGFLVFRMKGTELGSNILEFSFPCPDFPKLGGMRINIFTLLISNFSYPNSFWTYSPLYSGWLFLAR